MLNEDQQPGPSRQAANQDDSNEITDLERLRRLIPQLDRAEDFVACLNICEKALQTFEPVEFQILKAKYEILLGRFFDANQTLNKVLDKDPKNPEAIATLGFSFYHQGKLQTALQLYQKALVLKPNMIEVVRNRTIAMMLWSVIDSVPDVDDPETEFTDHMVQNLSESLLIDPRNKETMKVLHHLLGFTCYKLKLFLPAIENLTSVIELDETNYKVFFLRAKCYLAAADYEDAIIDLMEVSNFPKSKKVSAEIEAMRREVGKNFAVQTNYDILEVDRDASEQAIEASFQSFLLLHKNRIDNAKTESEKRKHDFKFRKVECAYAILANQKTREKYDNILEAQETTIECLPVQPCCKGCGNICTSMRNGLATCVHRTSAGISNGFTRFCQICHFCFFTCIGYTCSSLGRCLERFCLNESAILGFSSLIMLSILGGTFYLMFVFVRYLCGLVSSYF